MKTNTNIFTYFLSRTLFLGGGISMMFLYSNKDSYIACILGTLLGIGILYLFSYFQKKISPSLNHCLRENNILNIIFKIIYILYLLFITFIILIILSTFIHSYFLPFTPTIMSCLPFIFLAFYLNGKKIKNIYYIAFILFILSILTIITKTSLLTNELKVSNIFPIMMTSTSNLFKSSGIYCILSTAPFLINLGNKTTFKESLKYYLIAALANFIVILTIIFILGEMVSIYSYPEYAILRKISFFQFVENIENFISVSWFFDLFISLSLISVQIKETLNLQKNIISFILSILILLLTNKIVANNFYNSIAIYKVFPLILLGFIIILFLLLFFKTKKISSTNETINKK